MTELGTPQPAVKRFSIGGVLAAGLRTIGRGFVPVAVATIAISVVQFGVLFWAIERMLTEITAVPPWINWVLVITNTVADALLNAVLTGLALTILEDGQVDWRRALARVPMVFLPIAILSGIYALIARFGVPGLPHVMNVFVLLAIGSFTWLYASTLVREGGNPLTAIRRNLQLTKGQRWRILVLLVIVIVVYFVLAFGGGMVLGTVYALMKVRIPTEGPIAVEMTVTQLLNAATYITAAASYHMLSQEKDMHGQAAVARVFD
jgi:hypothetical protein